MSEKINIKGFFKKFGFYLIAIPLIVIAVVLIAIFMPKDVDLEIEYLRDAVLDNGKSHSVEYSISVKNAIKIFKVDDENIAKIENDTIYALEVGTTNFTLEARYGGEVVKKTANITVNAGLVLEIEDIYLEVEDEYDIAYDVKFNGEALAAADYQIDFEISDESVVSLEDAKLTALSIGKTNLIITATYGERTTIKTVAVDVKERNLFPFEVFVDNEKLDSNIININEPTNFMFRIGGEASATIQSSITENITITPYTAVPNTYIVNITGTGNFALSIKSGTKTRCIIIVYDVAILDI